MTNSIWLFVLPVLGGFLVGVGLFGVALHELGAALESIEFDLRDV